MLRGRNRRDLRLPWLTLSTGAVATLVYLAPASIGTGLQLDRSAIALGAFWSLLTAHLVHWSFEHYIWDVLIFVAIGAFVESRSRGIWLQLNLISALAISLSVLAFRSDLQSYRGLSGLDMALASYWVLSMLQTSWANGQSKERWMWGVALAVLIAKPMVEMAIGGPMFVHALGDGVENVALAHLVGALVGLLLAGLYPCDFARARRFRDWARNSVAMFF